jgi:hypothetical protein
MVSSLLGEKKLTENVLLSLAIVDSYCMPCQKLLAIQSAGKSRNQT